MKKIHLRFRKMSELILNLVSLRLKEDSTYWLCCFEHGVVKSDGAVAGSIPFG